MRLCTRLGFLAVILPTALVTGFSLVLVDRVSGQEAGPPAEESVSYARDIRPIFQAHCMGCHQPAKQAGDYLMTDFDAMLAGGESGEAAIVSGHPDDSWLVDLITPTDGVASMPQDRSPLGVSEIGRIRLWIEQGAVNDSQKSDFPFDLENPPRYSRQPVITSLDVSPDGTLLAVSGIHEVILCESSGGKTVRRLIGRSPRIESVSFSPDGKSVAVAGGQPGEFGELQIWDVESGELKQSVSFTGDTLFGASWSPDGRQVAFGATDNTVRAIDANSGNQVLFQNVAEDWIRDTIYSVDGSHLISVGRDMTCKLTEVATGRFVDNITSITPGILKGGISSVARHPERDEILIGSADGIPKLYRVFRETKRVIGDDANLIRQFPQMPGRIQAVAISQDGKKFAMASGIDGESEIRVFSAEFDTTVPEDIRAINSKVNHSPEENQRLQQFLTSDINQLAITPVSGVSLYSLVFSADGQRLFSAGSDGIIREIDAATGTVARTLAVFDSTASTETRVAELQQRLPVLPDGREGSPSLSEVPATEKLVVTPSEIHFDSPARYAQLVVRATFENGSQIDVTSLCSMEGAENIVAVNSNAIAEPVASGSGEIIVTFGGHSVAVPVTCSLENPPTVDFIRDVNPLLGRVGCNSGTCHGSQNGKRGFKLSLRGYDPVFDIRALTDDLASRRVNVAAPDESLMLLKATGQVPHEGGAVIQLNDKNYSIIRQWIQNGAQLDLSVPRVTAITIEPQLPVLPDADFRQQMRVVATWSDGTTRDVTREAFLESSDLEVVTTNAVGQAIARRRGEAAILARYEGAFAATTLTVMGERPGFVWNEPPAHNRIDELVARKWERMKIVPSGLCNDYEFLRRIHLDLTGLPPDAGTIRSFVADQRPTREKRDAMIDALIGSPQFVDHWTNKWSDLLQVNEKFLAKEGAAKFHDWIRGQIDSNVPYDQFVRSVVTASGSNAESPAAAYYKILRTPEDLMENTTHLFLATRFNCNKCHDHPFERWTQDQYYQTAAWFAQVDRQRDPASGDRNIGGSAVESATPLFEIIGNLTSGEVIHDRTKLVTAPVFPFESNVSPNPEAPRREQFAEWLTSPDNPYFASSHANRLWGYLLGTGLIEPLDDIRASNPPTNPQLLEFLTRELIDHDFDSRHLIRMICQSRTYQLSVATNPLNADDHTNYSHALPRRLPAEVLYDALYFVTGSQTHFPGEKPGLRAAQLPDAGAKLPSGLLATLGKPVRESACECERASDMHLGSVLALVSGPDQTEAINDSDNAIAGLVGAVADDGQLVNELYLRILNREATSEERAAASAVFAEISTDHQRLITMRDRRAAEVAPEYARLEQIREEKLEAAQSDLQSYMEVTDPELPGREAAHAARLADLRNRISQFDSTLDEQLLQSREDHLATLQWHAILASELSQSSGGEIKRLPDRSILASGNRGNTTTAVVAATDLPRISAIRLEVLAADDLPGRGPGLAPNGNFVVHEFTVEMATPDAPDEWRTVPLVLAMADFSQDGFDVSNLVDGNLTETGWAVVPETGKTHWATFQLVSPLAPVPGTRLRFSLAQNYRSDDQHQLGRFRISLTPSVSAVGLSVSEEVLELLSADPAGWNDDQRNRLREYVRAGSPLLVSLRSQLTMAEVPLQVDPGIVQRRELVQHYSVITPRDAELVRLERDAEQSQQQLDEFRMTAAQDLTWALINSSAFLFNH